MSFIEYSENSHFPIQNLPYGVFSDNKCVRIIVFVFGVVWCGVGVCVWVGC